MSEVVAKPVFEMDMVDETNALLEALLVELFVGWYS
jgi:hypothetical protein